MAPKINPSDKVNQDAHPGQGKPEIWSVSATGAPAQSMHVVLQTPELLEAILLCLDMRTLLTSAQIVSWRWHHIIQDSPRIQRALFFQADDNRPDIYLIYNPLLAELLPMFFDTDGNGQIEDLAIEVLPIVRRVRVMYRQDSSWRRMHVRQPPVRHVGLLESVAGQMAHNLELEMLIYPEGLRMEELYVWGLKHSFDWEGYVCWGKQKVRGLRLWQWLMDPTRGLNERADELAREADVVFASRIAGTCVEDEWDTRKTTDAQGLVTIGGEWFRCTPAREKKSKLVWKEGDSQFY